jgi:hypothetical protein
MLRTARSVPKRPIGAAPATQVLGGLASAKGPGLPRCVAETSTFRAISHGRPPVRAPLKRPLKSSGRFNSTSPRRGQHRLALDQAQAPSNTANRSRSNEPSSQTDSAPPPLPCGNHAASAIPRISSRTRLKSGVGVGKRVQPVSTNPSRGKGYATPGLALRSRDGTRGPPLKYAGNQGSA